jgi:hypothetical protein
VSDERFIELLEAEVARLTSERDALLEPYLGEMRARADLIVACVRARGEIPRFTGQWLTA